MESVPEGAAPPPSLPLPSSSGYAVSNLRVYSSFIYSCGVIAFLIIKEQENSLIRRNISGEKKWKPAKWVEVMLAGVA